MQINTFINPIIDQSVWNAKQLINNDQWIYHLTTEDIQEIEHALAINSNTAIENIQSENFPLPTLSNKIQQEFLEQLEHGIGTLLIKGLPIQTYSKENIKKAFKGIGAHFGHLVYQTMSGELLHEVTDAGIPRDHPQARGTNGKWELGFHNDPCDVAALLCINQAQVGGMSKIVSSASIHNIMLEHYPTLLQELYKPYPTLRHRSQPNLPVPYTMRPIFAFEQGYLCCNILRKYIDLGQLEQNIPKLTDQQIEALDVFEQLADSTELCYKFYLEPGDMWFVNNFTTLHAREAFQNNDNTAEDRLLLRLWLSVANSRPLPNSYAPIYNNIKAGSIRGGYKKQS